MNHAIEKYTELLTNLRESGFVGPLDTDVSLAKETYYKIGGPAGLFTEPSSISDLVTIHSLAGEHDAEILILGAGSNLIVADAGFDGIVVRLGETFSELEISAETMKVKAGAGCGITKLDRECADTGFEGIERLSGIPGTVGGAVFMNAGTYGDHFGELIESIDIYSESGRTTIGVAEAGFDYRMSRFQESGEIILGCELAGSHGAPDEIKAEVSRRLKHRNETQPMDLPSCGCVFRNPEGEKSAAMLIDEAGLKGLTSGGAEISSTHANFIVNKGAASAMEIIGLMAEARSRIFESTGVKLKPEVRLVGFDVALEDMLDDWKES